MTAPDSAEVPHSSPGAPRQVLARARSAYPSLTVQERRVADLIIDDPAQVIRHSINALAQQVEVSVATIVRCCQSLGYEGFRDLKLALASEASPSRWLVHDPVDGDDDALDIAKKVLSSDIQAISDTLAVLDGHTLQGAVDAMVSASRVEFYGIGSSVPIALDAYYRTVRLGLPATVVTDPHMQAISATHLPEGSVAFAISHTGRSFETHATLLSARSAGAKIILLTSYRNTPLGELADIEIVTATPESALRPEAVSCRIAQLAVIDALSVAIAVQRADTSRQALLRDDEIIAAREMP